MAYTFENPVIAQRLNDKFKGQKDAVRIAEVVDGLLGKNVKDIDGRSKKTSKDVKFHFDDPKGRIVKIENRLNRIESRLVKIELRLSAIEGKLDRLLNAKRHPKRRRKRG